jgi:AraC-like DNA-binding protein
MPLPVIAADSKLFQVLARTCQKILGPTPKPRDIVGHVRELVVDRLAKGAAQLDDVARELNMSSNTLERRLADRGATFSALLDEIRSGLAKRYLCDSDLRLDQIAYLTV